MEYKITPWKHQENAIDYAKDKKNVALFHDVGTGKTCSAINIWRSKCNQEREFIKTLVIAPIVVLQNWKREFLAHSNLVKEQVTVLEGSGKKKARQVNSLRLTQKRCVIVTNIESLQNREVFEAIKEYDPGFLILDESHMVKNYKSKRAKLLYDLAFYMRYKLILTGTPILNSVEDIFMQYKILDNGLTFGSNFFVFRNRYLYDKNSAWSGRPNHFPQYVARPELYQELQDKIYTKAHRAKKSECLDLPPYIVQDIEVELSKPQQKAYQEMRNDFITFVKDNSDKPKAVLAQLAVTKALRMMQITTGFVKTEEGEEINLGKNPRLDALQELLETITVENKVIVWCVFKKNYAEIKELCEKMGLPSTMLTGDMNQRAKDASIQMFQTDPAVKVMIANQQAGGTGVNLQAASYSIFYSRNFSLAHDLQAEARNYRGGSEIHEKVTRINIIAKDTIDELVSKALKDKVDLSEKIVDLVNDSLL